MWYIQCILYISLSTEGEIYEILLSIFLTMYSKACDAIEKNAISACIEWNVCGMCCVVEADIDTHPHDELTLNITNGNSYCIPILVVTDFASL